MTTTGQPEEGSTCASVQLVDEVHPARSVMAEGVFGSPLMQPLLAFPNGLLPKDAWFLWSTRTFSLQFRWLSPT